MAEDPKYSLIYLLYRRLRMLASVSYALTVLLPYHGLRNAIPSLRPDPRWSFRRALVIPFLQWFLLFRKANADILQARAVPLQAELEKRNVLYITAPAWKGELKGEVAKYAERRGIERVDVPCYWFGDATDPASALDQPARPGEKVFMSFHGGGYANGSATPDDPASFAASHLVKFANSGHRILSVEYRLSSLPAGSGRSRNPFPTALIDALTAFHHLLSLGFEPSQIYPMGDSAGGNLAFAMCYYLLYQENIRPGGLILLSPWADVSGSHTKPGMTRLTNYDKDILHSGVEPGSIAYLGFLGGPDDLIPDTLVYVSPACRDIAPPKFEGWPRTYIAMGEDEQFLDEGRTLYERLSKSVADPSSIVFDVTPAMPHDFCAFSPYEPERTELVKRIAKWVDLE